MWLLLASSSACGDVSFYTSPSSPDLFEYQEDLKQSLEKCGNIAEQVNIDINAAEKNLEKEYRKIKKDEELVYESYKEVKSSWRGSSLEIAAEIVSLTNEYESVTNISRLYFQRMDEIIEELRESPDYEDLFAKAQAKRTEFTKELTKAQEAINRIRETQRDIQNFDKVLELYATFGDIDKQIQKLKALTYRADMVTRDLIKFSKTGNQIVDDNLKKNT